MKLSSFASSALATTRSTFKGLAEAAVATGDNTDAQAKAPAAAEKPVAPKPGVKADSVAVKPKGIRLGTVLDAYA
jgi:hypothetical protein